MLKATHLANGRSEVGPQVCPCLSTLLCWLYTANQPDTDLPQIVLCVLGRGWRDGTGAEEGDA